MAKPNILELQRVTGRDGSAAPVAGIDLKVESGKTLVLLGPARAGKSSLLRLIAGFGVLEQGHIVFNGHDMRAYAPHRRPFTLLTDQNALFPHMTIASNVAYGLKARKLAPAEQDARIGWTLDLVGLRGLETVYPRTLNTAERQQAALARALAVEPLVLLLDEALSQLDPLGAARILSNLRDLQRRVELSIVLATTDAELAMGMADSLAILNQGRLIDHDRPSILYASPRSALTARLTGPVNLVPGEILPESKDNDRESPAGQVARSGAGWALALRPDHLEIHLNQPSSPAPRLEGRVERISYAPSGMSVRIQIAGMGESLVARLDTARLDADDLPEGRRVWCTWADGAAHAVPLC